MNELRINPESMKIFSLKCAELLKTYTGFCSLTGVLIRPSSYIQQAFAS